MPSLELDMGRGIRTVIALSWLLFSACVTPTQISSNKAQDYTAEPKRVFVVTDVGTDFGEDFANAFQAKLLAIAADCGSAAQLSRISALELDDRARVREVDTFKPDTFLSIRRNGGTKLPNGALVDVIYDVRLIDIQSKRIVWRAAVTFYRGGTAVVSAADRGAALAIDITNRMKEDHVFRTCEVIKTKQS
jgi:hypothetical protein